MLSPTNLTGSKRKENKIFREGNEEDPKQWGPLRVFGLWKWSHWEPRPKRGGTLTGWTLKSLGSLKNWPQGRFSDEQFWSRGKWRKRKQAHFPRHRRLSAVWLGASRRVSLDCIWKVLERKCALPHTVITDRFIAPLPVSWSVPSVGSSF